MRKTRVFEASEIKRRAILAALAALVACGQAGAASLSGAVHTADAVVRGSVSGYTDNVTSVSFTINIESVVMGNLGGATAIEVSHPWTYPGKLLTGGALNPVGVGLYLHGIWCLQRKGTSAWDIVPRGGGMGGDPSQLFWSTPASLSADYQAPSGASALDKLMIEAAAGIEDVGVSPRDIVTVIETYPPAAPTPAIQAILSHWSTLSLPGFREVAVSNMLKLGVPGAVGQLVRLGPIDARWAGTIAKSIEQSYRDTTPTSVTQLVQYAAAPSTPAQMRRAAVRALAAMHTKEALPFLATLLDSGDAFEQGQGIYGLGAFANGCPPQTPENVISMDYIKFKNPSAFKTDDTIAHFAFGGNPAADEPEHVARVAFWKAWWKTNGDVAQKP